MPPMSSMLLRRHWARRRGEVTDRFASWEFGLSHDAARDQYGEQQRCSNFLHVFSFQINGRESPERFPEYEKKRGVDGACRPALSKAPGFESAEVIWRDHKPETQRS